MTEGKDSLITHAQVEVRGRTAYNRPASIPVRFLALVTDASWILAAICLAIRVFRFSPIPTPSNLVGAAALYLLVRTAMRAAFGATLGQALWRLKVLGPKGAPIGWSERLGARSTIYQREKLTTSGACTCLFMTIVVLGSSVWVARETLWRHPLLARAELMELEPFVPLDAKPVEWAVMPFFYSLGAWPAVFNSSPVLYSLPYQKGPPTRFVGTVVARWAMPDTELVIEGPKTPKQGVSPEELRQCLQASWDAELVRGSFHCLELREAALSRHLSEILRIDPRDYVVKWFHVRNPALPESEQPRGIYLSARGATRIEERFILINASGTHQTFILRHAPTTLGDIAHRTFFEAIRSQRVSSELNPGRAWVDRKLASTELQELQKIENSSEFVTKLAEIQGLLLSKISVDPKTYDSYYHLGGTALMLGKRAAASGNPEWGAIAGPLLKSAVQYARDLAPRDARTAQLETMWLELAPR